MPRVSICIDMDQGETVPQLILEFLENLGREEDIFLQSAVDTSPTGDELDAARLDFLENLLGGRARLPVANGQKALLKALIDVPWEEGLSRGALIDEIGRSNAELSGLLGAFGRRIKGTAGYENVSDGRFPTNAILYTQKNGDWCYRLKPWVRKGLEEMYNRGQIQWLRDDKRY